MFTTLLVFKGLYKNYAMRQGGGGSPKSDFCKILHDKGGGGVRQKVTNDDQILEGGQGVLITAD